MILANVEPSFVRPSKNFLNRTESPFSKQRHEERITPTALKLAWPSEPVDLNYVPEILLAKSFALKDGINMFMWHCICENSEKKYLSLLISPIIFSFLVGLNKKLY